MILDLLLKCIVGMGVVAGIGASIVFVQFIYVLLCLIGNEIAKVFGGRDSYANFRFRDLILGVLALGIVAGIFILIGSIINL